MMLSFTSRPYCSTSIGTVAGIGGPGSSGRSIQWEQQHRCRRQLSALSELFRHRDWSSNGSVFKKSYCHLARQTDATVRRGKRWDIALMHRVTASEEHRIRHPRARSEERRVGKECRY